MRVKVTPAEQVEADRLSERAKRCATLLAEMNRLDPVGSPLSEETNALCDILDAIKEQVDSGSLHVAYAFRLMEVLFDLQEEIIAEDKKAQLTGRQR